MRTRQQGGLSDPDETTRNVGLTAAPPRPFQGTVLLLTTGLGVGGAENQVVELAKRLVERGWHVKVASLTCESALADRLQRGHIPVYFLGADKANKAALATALLRLARLVRAVHPSIVHAHMVHANLYARMVRLFVKVPAVICTAHSVEESSPGRTARWRELAYRLTDPLCDLTTHVSREGRERYVRVRAAPARKIRYIPNGVDVSRFAPDKTSREEKRMELGAKDAFVWLSVARLAPPKDYSTLLDAFDLLGQTSPAPALWIAGEGEQKEEILDRVRRSKIESSVRLLGLREDVPGLMSGADGFVLSSRLEGLPMVLLEAGASGLPTVTSDTGGTREAIREGETGYLVPPGDAQAMAAAMLRIMALPAEARHSMGQAARRHVLSEYALDRVAEQWEAIYAELKNRR